MGIPWIRLIPPCSSRRENPSGPNWCCCSGSLVRAGHWELLRPLSRGRWNSQGMEFLGDGIPRGWAEPLRVPSSVAGMSLFLVFSPPSFAFSTKSGKSHVFNTKTRAAFPGKPPPPPCPGIPGLGNVSRSRREGAEQGKRDHSPPCPRPSKAFPGEFYPKSLIPPRPKLPSAGSRADTPESSLGFLLQEGIPEFPPSLNLSSSSSLIFLLQI